MNHTNDQGRVEFGFDGIGEGASQHTAPAEKKVLDDKGVPWTGDAAKEKSTSTTFRSMLPTIAAGIGAAALIGVGVALLVRQRRIDNSFKARALRFIASPLVRQIAGGVGGMALGALGNTLQSVAREKIDTLRAPREVETA